MSIWRHSPRPRARARGSGTTLRQIEAQPRRFDDYEELADAELLEEARTLADELADARVLQVSATANGGGVAELVA